MNNDRRVSPQVTITDLLEKMEYHRNEQISLMEQIEEHLPEGFTITELEKPQSKKQM